jgi:hypothetical protein
MRHMPMTTDAQAIRVGVVDALLNVSGYKFQRLRRSCRQNIFIFLVLTRTAAEQIPCSLIAASHWRLPTNLFHDPLSPTDRELSGCNHGRGD